MKRMFLLVAAAFMFVACGGGPSDEAQLAGPSDSSSESSSGVSSAASTESSGDSVRDLGFALDIEEFGDRANWWYSSSEVDAVLCGELSADRTLRLYRSSDKENRQGSFCEDGGGSILNLRTVREFEQPDVEGAIEVLNGDIGTIVGGGDIFGKSDVGTVTVEVRSATDPSVEPVTFGLEMSANIGQVSFAFVLREAVRVPAASTHVVGQRVLWFAAHLPMFAPRCDNDSWRSTSDRGSRGTSITTQIIDLRSPISAAVESLDHLAGGVEGGPFAISICKFVDEIPVGPCKQRTVRNVWVCSAASGGHAALAGLDT